MSPSLNPFKNRILHFDARHASFSKRNGLIAQALPEKRCWILDIGSNTGHTGNMLGEAGHVVLGIEKMEKEHRLARKHAHNLSASICADVNAEIIGSGPTWDAVLLLSVLHRIYAFEGQDVMRSVLAECGKKTDSLFIEGSVRHARYTDNGQPAPDFVDMDLGSAEAWHRQLFEDVLGSEWSIPKPTELKCSTLEPFRLYFHVQRKG